MEQIRETHDYIQETGDVSVGYVLEDLNLAFETLEKLRGELAPADGLDGDLMVGVLPGWFA